MNKADCTYTDKITELLLDITHPNNHGKTYILLEGDTDIRLFRKLFNISSSRIEQVPGGNVKVLAALEELLKKSSLVIAIRDADFLHLNNLPSPHINMFMTDYHDIEITMATCNTTYCAVAHEYRQCTDQEHIELRENLMNLIKFVSCLRWYNDMEDIKFNFKAVKLSPFYDGKNNSFDFNGYLKELIKSSTNASIKDRTMIIDDLLFLSKQTKDMFQLSNGHDFVRISAAYFNSINKAGVSESTLSSNFRVAFSLDSFKRTNLYSQTLAWANANGVNIHN